MNYIFDLEGVIVDSRKNIVLCDGVNDFYEDVDKGYYLISNRSKKDTTKILRKFGLKFKDIIHRLFYHSFRVTFRQ